MVAPKIRQGRVHTALLLLISAILVSGCSSIATQTKFYEPIQESLRAGNYDVAVAKIEKAFAEGKYAEKDRFLYYLDAGLAYHYADSFAVSADLLNQAEIAADELFTKSISRAAASLLLNDNVLEYAGEDHEALYTNLFKALDYIELGRNEDAFVEIRRANLKLQNLEQKYFDAAQTFRSAAKSDSTQADLPYDIQPLRFSNSAFARYLSMHMYATATKFDDARIDYELLHEAFKTQPQIYDFRAPEIKYACRDKAILSIVAMTGTSPVKNDLKLRIRTDKQLDLVQVMYDGAAASSAEYGHFLLPISEDYYFKFAIPVMSPGQSEVAAIRVTADGRPIGELQLIENVNRVAAEVFEPKKTLTYVRTVARAVVKGLAAHKLKEDIDEKNDDALGSWLLRATVDVGADVLENADLRCSRLLPSYIYVADFELEPGAYDIEVEFANREGEIIDSYRMQKFPVAKSALNLFRVVSLN
ncbi:MAG: hypothetical protein WBP29_02930 [Candidatus Zixiibacteriota bacterium]